LGDSFGPGNLQPAFTLILLSFRGSGDLLFIYNQPAMPFTPRNFILFLFSEPGIILSLGIIGAINLTVYGIHGKRLGTHFNIEA
jgi:hypothetical protein